MFKYIWFLSGEIPNIKPKIQREIKIQNESQTFLDLLFRIFLEFWIWYFGFQNHFNIKTSITSTKGDTIAEKDKLDRILMSLRELDAWEKRKDNIKIQIRKGSREERKELRQKLLNIDHQIQYYTNLVKDMKHKMKPTHVPDILNALLGHRMREI